jgi:hypothetical protein
MPATEGRPYHRKFRSSMAFSLKETWGRCQKKVLENKIARKLDSYIYDYISKYCY